MLTRFLQPLFPPRTLIVTFVAGRRFFLDGGIPFQIKTDRSASVEGEKDLKCKKRAGFIYVATEVYFRP